MFNLTTLEIDIQKNERAFLSCFVAFIQQCDPDVLVGHNFIGFGLDVLLHRLKLYKMDQVWSKIGRLRRNKWPKLQAGAGGMGESSYQEKAVTSGRLICDTYLAARVNILSPHELGPHSIQKLLSHRTCIDTASVYSRRAQTRRSPQHVLEF